MTENKYKVKPNREFSTGKNSKVNFSVFENDSWICSATTHTTAQTLMTKGIPTEAAESIIQQIKEKSI